MSNNFKPSVTMRTSRRKQPGYLKFRTATLRVSHIATEIHSALCIHIFGDDFGGFYDTTRLRIKIHLQKTNMEPQNCWFADVSSRWGIFRSFFRFHICLFVFGGGVFQHNVKHRSPGRRTDIQLRTHNPMPWFNSCWGHLEADHESSAHHGGFCWIDGLPSTSRGENIKIQKLQEASHHRSSKTKDWFGPNC